MHTESLAQQAITLAGELLESALAQQTRAEKHQATKIAGMMDDPAGKLMTMALSDQAFRSHDPKRINGQIRHLIEGYGVPSYFADWEQVALELGTRVGQYIPHLVVPLVVAKLRAETHNVILPGEEDPLRAYLQERRAGGTRLNLNHLGEAILGEAEAERRLDAYLALLARPDVEYISIKISSIFSQINLAAFDQTVAKINVRLRALYRAAMQHRYVLPDGTALPKFINLDMEEYGDLHLTIAAFQQVLDEPEFHNYRAGIVLQAYLPDAHMQQQKLTTWAQDRVTGGGAPIKIRLVKGANLAMEKVEASLHGWEQAPYYTKADVDANYKRMVLYGCEPEHAQAANLGIASHNLFDVAFGLIVREQHGVEAHVEFEMLEGMANHQARAVQAKAGGLLLYAPAVKEDDFHSAIAYLVRRLDENTADENFLRDLFSLEVGNATWEKQKQFFLNSVARRDEVSPLPNRRQNRLANEPLRTHNEQLTTNHPTSSTLTDSAAAPADPQSPIGATPFANAPDTDFSLPANQEWARQIVARWEEREIESLPLQIGGELIYPNDDGVGHDPSHPNLSSRYQYALGRPEHVEAALVTATLAQQGKAPIAERRESLLHVAAELAKRRGDLIGAAMLDGGKSLEQADVEVSEAIDFANYYARALDTIERDMVGSTFTPFGTVLITSPWNFPIAIPAGGMLAALMAGNTVIFKPAPEVVLVAWELVNAFWSAGIPRTRLQFLPTTDDEVGQALVTDPRVSAVILTGAYETAQLFLGWKPEMRLLAETSGKNSLIISAMADHDLAIKDLVYSAFGHNGQKCSAASLAVLEAEVYDSPIFLRQLKDAAASMPVGSAWDLSSKITPLISAPNPYLFRALTRLEAGESWLLEPQLLDSQLWTPGIKLGVKPGSYYHQTECFGPVLGLMRADSITHAIELVNQSEFGLTSGLHSLDDREVALWRERIEVGNAYINRGTTGAIVRRQPFGGWKKSAFGSGVKAGGPNYVLSLGHWSEPETPGFEQSYRHEWETHFSQEHDPSLLLGESNGFRYRPIASLVVRVGFDTELVDLTRIKLAADLAGVTLTLSAPTGFAASDFFEGVELVLEDESVLTARIGAYERLRHLGQPSLDLLRAAHIAHVYVDTDPVISSGRLELRHYLREQSVTETTHRYGNILSRPKAG